MVFGALGHLKLGCGQDLKSGGAKLRCKEITTSQNDEVLSSANEKNPFHENVYDFSLMQLRRLPRHVQSVPMKIGEAMAFCPLPSPPPPVVEGL